MALDHLASHDYWRPPLDPEFTADLQRHLESEPLSWHTFQRARHTTPADEMPDAPARIITSEQRLAEDSVYAQPFIIPQAELSDDTQEAATNARHFLYPSNFAEHYSRVQAAHVPKMNAADYFDWHLDAATVRTNAAATRMVLREPASPRDEDFESHTEVPHAGGSVSASLREATVNIEPKNNPQTMFNTAYTRLQTMPHNLFVRRGSSTVTAKQGMEVYAAQVGGFEKVPAAAILQRGLLAYDALQLVASVDSEAAHELLQTPEAIPDFAYLKFVHLTAGSRPHSLRHGPDSEYKGLITAGMDISALRCLAFSDNAIQFNQARQTIINQTEDSFGPEFLPMIDTIHAQYPDESQKAEFMTWVNKLIEADRLRSDLAVPKAAGRIVLPHTVEYDDDSQLPDTDNSQWAYTVPYAITAIHIEDMYLQVNQKGYFDRIDRIGAATHKSRALKATARAIVAEYGRAPRPLDITEQE